MESFVSVSSLILCLMLIIFTFYNKIRTKKNYAPGPWGFPLVGHLPLFGQRPTETFRSWNKTYGNVFRIRLGSWNAVVLNGYATIKEALERRGDIFSSRPEFLSTKMSKEARDNEESVEFGPFNTAYQKQRKLTAYALRKFTTPRNDYLENLVQTEAGILINNLLTLEGKPQRAEELLSIAVASVVYQVLFGKGGNVLEDHEFMTMFRHQEAFVEFVGSGNAIDVLPWLRYIMPWKIKEFMNFVHLSDSIAYRKIDAHKASFRKDALRDDTDVFIAANLPKHVQDKTSEVAEMRQMITLSDLLGAGFGTTSRTMQWLILYMTAYPEIQRKVQLEIDSVVGKEGIVNLSDRGYLDYTQAVILEVMRIRNVAPLGVAHFTSEDTTVNGFDIDKNTVIIPNLTSANQNESIWDTPEAFKPERHSDCNDNLLKRSPVASFGFGRRACIGEYFAKMELFLFFAMLMQRCMFENPADDDTDLEPVEDLLISPKSYRVIVTDRKRQEKPAQRTVNFDGLITTVAL